MRRQRLTFWIIGSALTCAALGAWLGHQLEDGRAGNVALISATFAVLGSFLPGAIRWTSGRTSGRTRSRLRRRGRPHRGPA